MNRWPAPAEFRSLGVLAAPIIITQLAQMGMGVADAIMAGRVSATELARIALGGNLYWPLMLLMSGIVMAVTPWVSQLHGEGMAWTRPAMFIGLRFGVRSPNKCPTIGACGPAPLVDHETIVPGRWRLPVTMFHARH